ncbi:OmpA family protein [Stappia sp. 28M-7]|uniref:OmpA family protein n=1 Tax=Stappia sp. 28M-7 TaxID=2762596 RepID=UPI0035301CB2
MTVFPMPETGRPAARPRAPLSPLLFAGLVASALLAGCNTVENVASPDVTNAPVLGFANMEPGSEEAFMLNVGRRTYFTPGSADIDETARMTLDKQAEWLKTNRTWFAKIQGFADDPGSAGDNTALSTRRANAVMAYLVGKGVSPNRLWAKGYGTERKVRDCAEEECKAQNRRVVTNLREERER